MCFDITESDNIVGEALSKVFEMRSNAVIIVKQTSFELIDALGNLWCKTKDEVDLLNSVFDLYQWNRGSIRKESIQVWKDIQYEVNIQEMEEFCDIIKDVSDKVENERGGRYFGNASTRCSKMFPSVRSEEYILVSKRNVPKDRIKPSDFVVTQFSSTGNVLYFNEHKPSVDTPGQLKLYQEYLNINYMIHGHAYIAERPTTDRYCSCGDLREFTEINKVIKRRYVIPEWVQDKTFFAINLKNHGFIIATDSLEKMRKIVNESNFIYRDIGEELI